MEIKYLNLEYFYYKIFVFLSEGRNIITEGIFEGEIPSWLVFFASFLSLLFAVGIVYNIWKIFKIRKKQIGEYVRIITEDKPEDRITKWDLIKKRLDSENPSDWKQAILEADSLVDDIIKKIGYRGETFGERLSNITLAQFKCLNKVWEAHKIRNRIAHEGTNFQLNKLQAERVIGMYEEALIEMEYIKD
ncbi:MAG: hypothetical protein ABII97_01485 [Patescibacteria group bacterium]